jgi:hypothetical protein
MRKRERKNNKMRLMRGEAPADTVAKAKELRDSFEKLHPQATQLADLLDRPPIELADEPDEDEDDFGGQTTIEVCEWRTYTYSFNAIQA